MKHHPPVIAVSGIKNSGKTTLLAGIIPLLRQKGLRLAVIKHDGHDFSPDVPGTDSFRLRLAGAETVAVYSARRFFLTSEQADLGLENIIDMIKDVDLILVEGAKASAYPKIEIVRAAISSRPVCSPESLLALCTDTSLKLEGIETAELSDFPKMAGIICRHLNK